MDKIVHELIPALIAVLKADQREELYDSLGIDPASLVATGLKLAETKQLVQIMIVMAREAIQRQEIDLEIDETDIEKGILKYEIVGDEQYVAYLNIIAGELSKHGQQEFEKSPDFHMTAAVISGAQEIASVLKPKAFKKLMDEAQEEMAKEQPQTRGYAEKTRDFYNNLLALVKEALQEQSA